MITCSRELLERCLLMCFQWANVTPAAAEHKVMSYIPHLKQPPTQTQTGNKPINSDGSSASGSEDDGDVDGAACMPVRTNSISDPYGTREWRSNLVKLSGKNRAINEFSVERLGERVENNLVMVHGYGAGLGFFYKNFEALSQAKGWKVYALDMLGMGRSSRPPFKIQAKEGEARIREAEDWFIDAIEEWRMQRKIERFTLLGHSLGGYLAVAYALKYPGHLNKLVLASPVGIPEDPYAMNAEMPEPPNSTFTNEVLQDQQQTTTASNPNIPESAKAGDKNTLFGAKAQNEAATASSKTNGAKDTTAPTAPRRPYPKWLTYLWDANFSPFGLIRWSGPLGPRFVSGWTSRRFNHLPPDEAQALHTYAYTLFKQRGSGEYALAYLLAPGAFARSPLIHRIGGVGRQPIPPKTDSTPSVVNVAEGQGVKKETGIPVVLMYGENDWMDVAGGYASEKKLNEIKQKVLREGTEEEKRRENGDAKVIVIRKAGHHVYLDGYDQFNEEMLREMKDVERREQRLGNTWEGC